MNRSNSAPAAVAAAIAVALYAGAVSADTLIMMDHKGHMGPRYEAVMQCIDAARHAPALGDGLTLSKRIGTSTSPEGGSRTVVLGGHAWENGARVPVTVRCEMGPRGRVASVVRIEQSAAVADAAR